MIVSAAVLAGGRARRFEGRDKSALLVDGHSILDRQLAALAPLTDDVLIVGGGARPLAGVRSVDDPVTGRGPLAGVVAALTHARHELTLVLACDMPFVTTPLLRHLASLAAGVDAVVPRTERGYHPLCAVYARACLGPAERRLQGGRLRLGDLLDELRVRVVTGDEIGRFGDPGRLLANVNTPDEYRQVEPNHQASS